MLKVLLVASLSAVLGLVLVAAGCARQQSGQQPALAEKQKVCPVSGEPLGKMGKPYKVTVEGREVLLCCPGCEAKIRANSDEYLAKLPQ